MLPLAELEVNAPKRKKKKLKNPVTFPGKRLA